MPEHPDVALNFDISKGLELNDSSEQDNRMVRKEADSSGESATAHTTHETCPKAPMGLYYEGRNTSTPLTCTMLELNDACV